MNSNNDSDMTRREFLRRIGIGTGSAMALMALEPLNILAQSKHDTATASNRMTHPDVAVAVFSHIPHATTY